MHGRTSSPDALYVHAPFCARRCRYCDFAVTVRRAPGSGEWLEALRAEWALLREEDGWIPGGPLRTIYVGGGTPSLLGPDAMAGLRAVLGEELLADPELEWTAEANPESLTPALAESWREAGVNRLSLGVQSFQAAPLRWMGRLHGAEGAREAVRTAREAGIGNLSIDLIFALPDAAARNWREDLDEVLALDLPHISLYGLTIEEGTRLFRDVVEGRVREGDPERYREEFLEAAELLTAAGYHHYEVSNFAFPGMESRHNSVYWSGAPYLGIGNSSHSFRNGVRRWNLRDWGAYRTRLAAGRLPIDDEEILDREAERLERVWLGLRTAAGIPLEELAGATGLLARWEEEGWARSHREHLRLTPRGWLLLDRLTVELDEALALSPSAAAGDAPRAPTP